MTRTLATAFAMVLLSSRIVFAQSKPETSDRPANPIDAASYDADKVLARDLETHTFLGLGPTLGAPAGLNANLTFYTGRLMLSGSGMFYGPNWYGAQADVGFVLFQGPKLRHSLAVSGGIWRYAPLLTNDAGSTVQSYFSTKFIGASYTLFSDGFYLQLGGGGGFGDNKSPVLIFQAGYLFTIG